MTIDLSRSPSHLIHIARQKSDEIMMSKFTKNGLTPRQFAVLLTVSRTPGMSQKELAFVTGSDRSTITDLVTRLARLGHIDRTRSKKDARTMELWLTDQGREQLDAAIPKAESTDRELLSCLSERERDDFLNYLKRVGTQETSHLI